MRDVWIIDFSTPTELCDAVISVLRPKPDDLIYDGAFGNLGFFVAIKKFFEQTMQLIPKKGTFYGREVNESTFTKALELGKEKNFDTSNFKNEDTLQHSLEEKNKFDLIVSAPPWGKGYSQVLKGPLGIKSNDYLILFLQHYLHSLKEGGRAAIVVPNGFLYQNTKAHIELRKILINECNLFSIFALPEGYFNHTAIATSVLFFTKGQFTKEITYTLMDDKNDVGVFLKHPQNTLSFPKAFQFESKKINQDLFTLPLGKTFAINQEIDTIKKNFKSFHKFALKDICLEINLTKETFTEKKDTIYLPKIGTTSPVKSINETTLKHQNYFQLVLDNSKIDTTYLIYFFHSKLGRLLLSTLFKGLTIPMLSKNTLLSEMFIYLPTLEEQKLIGDTFVELKNVQTIMEKTTTELCSHPNSAKIILKKLQETKSTFNGLSEEDKIFKLIQKGENKVVEFKETLSKNIHTNTKDDRLQESVLKNLVGFLNRDGGHLLIGVSDKGEIKGIECDIYHDDDKYKLKLSQLIGKQIKPDMEDYIDYDIVVVQGKRVCVIKCEKSPEPAYLNGDFYLRSDPECKKLSAQAATEYISRRFKA